MLYAVLWQPGEQTHVSQTPTDQQTGSRLSFLSSKAVKEASYT